MRRAAGRSRIQETARGRRIALVPMTIKIKLTGWVVRKLNRQDMDLPIAAIIVPDGDGSISGEGPG